MAFCYRFSLSCQELKTILAAGQFKQFVKKFEPYRQLILYMDGSSESYLVSDRDILPANTVGLITDFYQAVYQEEFNKVCFEFLKYKHEGEVGLCGEIYGDTPIIGSPN